MTAKAIGIAVAEEDLPLLGELVDHFGHGNRSEFLRAAMKTMRHEMWAEKMRTLQEGFTEDRNGRVLTRKEIDDTIQQVLTANER